MLPEKYTELGFEITQFGANSKVLRFDQKPIFVFDSKSKIDAEFLKHICQTYLKLNARKNDLSGIKNG